jgi:predicted kinase
VEPATELARILVDQHGHQDVPRQMKRCFSDFEQGRLAAGPSMKKLSCASAGQIDSLTCVDDVDRAVPPTMDAPEPGVVVMMCGLPGSGKSTYAQALEGRGYTRLSIDEVVWERIGRDAAELDPDEYERLKATVEQELWHELIRLMDARQPVVVDYSFWNRATRDRYKALIESHGCRWELIRLKADLNTLRRRLAARNDQHGANNVSVTEELLNRYFANFEEPIGEGERVILQE